MKRLLHALLARHGFREDPFFFGYRCPCGETMLAGSMNRETERERLDALLVRVRRAGPEARYCSWFGHRFHGTRRCWRCGSRR